MKSQFAELVPGETELTDQIIKEYAECPPEDIATLYHLTQEGLILSARWVDIASNSSLYAKQYGISKTDFKDWAYQKYRTLQELHTDCRVFYKDAKEDLKNYGRVE